MNQWTVDTGTRAVWARAELVWQPVDNLVVYITEGAEAQIPQTKFELATGDGEGRLQTLTP